MLAALRDREVGEVFPRCSGFCRLAQWRAKEITSTSRMNAPTQAPITVPNDMLFPEEEVEVDEVVTADAADVGISDTDGVKEAS